MATLKVPVTKIDHIQGLESAPLTLVEYGDYECPFCREAYYVIQRLQEHFGKNLRFIFRNFPLSELHPFAEPAAETAEFAATYDQFWEMHDLIYENQADLSITMLLELGQSLELPIDELSRTIQNTLFDKKIRADFMSGVHSGVNGTPTFFINDSRYNGPFQFEELAAAIELVHH